MAADVSSDTPTVRATVRTQVNGIDHVLQVPPLRPLADTVRDELGLTGTKLGCQAGDCGSCTVLIDGVPMASCLTPTVAVDGHQVVTIEGLADMTPRASDDHASSSDGLHVLQDAFRRFGASQCGYCIPGIVMASVELLERPEPLGRDEVRRELAGNLCRCTGYESIVDAILAAQQAWRSPGAEVTP